MAKIDALKKEARRAEDREDWIEAIEYYGRAVSLAEEDESAALEVGLYNRIGDLYLKLEDTSQAVYHYLLAVDEYAEDELYSPAIALCRKILRVAPDQVDAYRKLAKLHGATGLMADAREEMDRYMAGVWEAGEVNGALDDLPELVASLMSGAPDLEEIERLKEEDRNEEAFELLYRQWEDDSARWSNGNGAAGDQSAGFPQTDPTDRSLGATLRRGWQGLFGEGEESADEDLRDLPELELSGPEAMEDRTDAAAEDEGAGPGAGADAEEAEAGAEETTESSLDEVDDMAWLREVTTSWKPGREEDQEEPAGAADDVAAEAEETAAEADPAGAAEAEELAEALAGEDEPEARADGPAERETQAADEDGAEAPAVEAQAPAVEAEASAEDEAEEDGARAADQAGEARADDEPAAPPAEVLRAAAESLTRRTAARPALPGNVVAPMLLSAAAADLPEGRAVVAERPLDRALRARLRQDLGRRSGGRPPEGPAFQTPGREDYLPAGAEVATREAGSGLLWLSDQVAFLGAMDRGEPVAVRPVFGPPPELVRSAAEALERSAVVEPVAALPADVAAPALLGSGVADEPWVAEPVVADAAPERRERRPPEGPAFMTPGREDYLPAGAEIGARLPGPGLSWLADAVDELHWLEWGEPAWLEAAREARARAAEALAGVAESAAAEDRPDLAGRRSLPAQVAAPEAAVVDEAAAEPASEELAATEVESLQPAAAAGSVDAPAAEPEGPAFQTPGRDDYLPAGEEIGDGVPSPALAWLASSVADIHRLDWGEPAFFDASPADVLEGPEVEEPQIRLDGYDPSKEEAAEATREALAFLAAEQVAAAASEPSREGELDAGDAEDAEDDGAAAAAAIAEAAMKAVESVDETEEVEAAADDEAPQPEAEEVAAPEEAESPSDRQDAGDDGAAAAAAIAEAAMKAVESVDETEEVDAAADDEAPQPEPEAEAHDEAPEPEAEVAEPEEAGDVQEAAGEPPAVEEEDDVRERAVAEAEPPAPERPSRAAGREPETAAPRAPFDKPDVSDPVHQPAARPNGLDFTALLQRIGWLKDRENGHASGHGARSADRGAVRPDTDDVVAPWSRGASGSSQGGDAKSGEVGSGGAPTVQPPTPSAPGSGVPDFTEMLRQVGWLRNDDRA